MTDANIRAELDADGVLPGLDRHARTGDECLLQKDLMDSLERIVKRAETEPMVKAVVLTSGKAAFPAGAPILR